MPNLFRNLKVNTKGIKKIKTESDTDSSIEYETKKYSISVSPSILKSCFSPKLRSVYLRENELKDSIHEFLLLNSKKELENDLKCNYLFLQNFDEIKNYKNYYPNNNSNVVIEKLKTKKKISKLSRKSAKYKFVQIVQKIINAKKNFLLRKNLKKKIHAAKSKMKNFFSLRENNLN